MQPSTVGKENFAVFPFSIRRLLLLCLLVAFEGGVLSACVSSEKYEAEKARSLNFQRLLAQEEKRTGELNVKYQEAQRSVSDLESKNRDLTTDLDALREQLDRTQSELQRLREGGGGAELSSEGAPTLDDPTISEFGFDDLDLKEGEMGDMGADLGGDMGADLGDSDLGGDMGGGDMGGNELGGDFGADMGSDLGNEMEPDMGSDLGGDMGLGMEPEDSSPSDSSSLYTVRRGDTLFSISRQYGVSVNELRRLNNIDGDLIYPGDQIRVSP